MIRIRIIWATALGILLPSIHHTDTVASLHAEIKWNLHPFSAFLPGWSLRFTGLVPPGDVCDSQAAGWVWSYRLGGRLERIMLHQPVRTMARRWRGWIRPHASTRSGLHLNTDFHSVWMNLGIVSSYKPHQCLHLCLPPSISVRCCEDGMSQHYSLSFCWPLGFFSFFWSFSNFPLLYLLWPSFHLPQCSCLTLHHLLTWFTMSSPSPSTWLRAMYCSCR